MPSILPLLYANDDIGVNIPATDVRHQKCCTPMMSFCASSVAQKTKMFLVLPWKNLHIQTASCQIPTALFVQFVVSLVTAVTQTPMLGWLLLPSTPLSTSYNLISMMTSLVSSIYPIIIANDGICVNLQLLCNTKNIVLQWRHSAPAVQHQKMKLFLVLPFFLHFLCELSVPQKCVSS